MKAGYGPNTPAFLTVLTAGILVRLCWITQPFVDQWSWRQADVAMIARNYLRHGFRFLWPQIDWAGSAPGYVGTEFPLVPSITALAYVVVGVHEWVGRAVSVGGFALASLFIYRVLTIVTSERSALFGMAAFASFPLSIFASRVFMSDMPALACALGALWSFHAFLQRSSGGALVRVTLWLTLAMLLKLPGAVIGLPMAYLAWVRHGTRARRHVELWGIALFAFMCTAAWYLHAWRIARAHEPHHLFGEEGLAFVSAAGYATRATTLVVEGITPVGMMLAVAGLLVRSEGPNRYLLHWWVLGCTIGTLAMGAGSRHPWYQLPLLPAVAGLFGITVNAALATAERRRRAALGWTATAMAFALLWVTSAHALHPLYFPWGESLRRAGMELRRTSPSDALVVFIDQGDPLGLYYSERNGWHFLPNGSIPLTGSEAVLTLEDLRRQGASVMVTTKYMRWLLDGYFAEFGQHVRRRYPMVRHTDDFDVYRPAR